MERTVLERIKALKGAIERMDDISVVGKETDAIFSEIDNLEGEEKENALDAMMDIAIDMIKDIEKSDITKLLDMLKIVSESKPRKKVKAINVKVNQYLDATLVEVSEKIPYSELVDVLEKVKENFKENFKDEIISLGIDRKKKCMELTFIKGNDIIVPIKHWNLNDESKDIYMEGFAEYIGCITE